MRAQISLRLPPDCWLFIQEMRSVATSLPLTGDVDAILSLPPQIELRMPIPEPRFIVRMTRPQLAVLHRWLHALVHRLSAEHYRRRTCLECISRVAGALRLSEP